MVSHFDDFCIIGVTVTVKPHDAFPAGLVNAQFTLVVPIGKVEPDGGTQLTVAPAPAVGVGYVTTAPPAPVAVVLIFAGQLKFGVTVTLKLHETTPKALLARHVTVVVPMLKVEPDGGVQITLTPCPVAAGVA